MATDDKNIVQSLLLEWRTVLTPNACLLWPEFLAPPLYNGLRVPCVC